MQFIYSEKMNRALAGEVGWVREIDGLGPWAGLLSPSGGRRNFMAASRRRVPKNWVPPAHEEIRMNRKVMFGVAVFVAVIGIGLLGGEKEAAAGRGCRGCGGGLFAGRCGGKEACHSDCGGCHRERCGGRNRCGGLFGGRKNRCAGRCGGQAACCAPAPACCEPAPACEPAPCATECDPCATGCPTGACGGAAAGEVITEQPAADKVPDAPKEGGAA